MSIEYISTRGQDERIYQFSDALLTSTATDGGLLVPQHLPEVSLEDLYGLCNKPYRKRVAAIVNCFQTNLPPWAIAEATESAYGKNFDDERIAPIVRLKYGQYMQELWHGPTAAFKDMALQLMPKMFSYAVELDNEERERRGEAPIHYLILVATSGDTGKAALEGYRDIPHCSIVTFFPYRHVSELQELQMATQEGSNVAVYAMRGTFDEAQEGVKAVFADRAFGEMLRGNNTVLSSANSINWGRIMPQIAYHFSGYIELMNQGTISPGTKIDIAVPTGNFGNILSAFYAKKMGLPIGKLICASNENDVLTEFLQTGIYDVRRRTLIQTPSPSMDILRASNIERLLHAITGNPQRVNRWMHELKTNNIFIVDDETTETLQNEFYAGSVSNDDCLGNIQRNVRDVGYLMDPHTSVAQAIIENYLEEVGIARPVVICSTAHWAKFPIDVRNALIGGQSNLRESLAFGSNDEFDMIKQVRRLFPSASPEPQCIAGLKHKPILHRTVIDATVADVRDAVTRHLRKRQLQQVAA